jgi:hypothetical protein
LLIESKKKSSKKGKSISKSVVGLSTSPKKKKKKLKKSKSVAKSENLGVPSKKKKLKRKGSKLMEPTASSMMKIKLDGGGKKGKKKSVRSVNDWVRGLRDTKAPPPRGKSKGKKHKGKGKSIKSVAKKLREKFIKKKKKAASSKKKKPISKSRSKAKGKGGKSVKKSKTPKKSVKKPKKSKTVKKKKKKVTKKKKKVVPKNEPEPEVHTEMIMLGGNGVDDEENTLMAKPNNIQFEQELKIEPENEEPEMINLKMQFGGGIDRENQVEAGTVLPMEKNVGHFELENNPGIHLEYNTGEGKLEFGPEDQIIEHIFTMHWSQVDKILIRAKVAENVTPPSKRMTIMEVGRDIYSKQRNKVYGDDNITHVITDGILVYLLSNQRSSGSIRT